MDAISLKKKIKEIQDLYKSDDKPWIIGYSGGKDSTCVLQLVYMAVSKLPKESIKKEIWVICGDTLVEIPTVVERIDTSLDKLNKSAAEAGLPIKGLKVYPEVNDSFFVNIIGKGYPSPTRTFRWCTERLKIDPASKFIKSKVDQYGEAIIILGARKAESMSRAQTLKKFSREGELLKKHSTLPSALVYAPIEDWDLKDVWTFLGTFDSPWGDKNKDLITMYQKAGGDECPMVIDTSTPSCGNSRFGCWVCTVVEQDKSIQGFIENGETWLEPMAEFRNMILRMREDRKNHRVVDKSRIGGYGPFKPGSRQSILKELFKVEKAMFEKYKQRIIRFEELLAIQTIWNRQGIKNTSVKNIWNNVYGINQKSPVKDFDEELLLVELCKKNNVPYQMIKNMLIDERDMSKYTRRKNIFIRLEKHLDEHMKESNANS
jgi:DNA sulfur modification protein DndC